MQSSEASATAPGRASVRAPRTLAEWMAKTARVLLPVLARLEAGGSLNVWKRLHDSRRSRLEPDVVLRVLGQVPLVLEHLAVELGDVLGAAPRSGPSRCTAG